MAEECWACGVKVVLEQFIQGRGQQIAMSSMRPHKYWKRINLYSTGLAAKENGNFGQLCYRKWKFG